MSLFRNAVNELRPTADAVGNTSLQTGSKPPNLFPNAQFHRR